MKYFIIIISTLLLASCTVGLEKTKTSSSNEAKQEQTAPSPTKNTSGALEFSNTGNVDISRVINNTYRYLDSEKKEYSSGTFTSLMRTGSK